jgi:hypothetical protein
MIGPTNQTAPRDYWCLGSAARVSSQPAQLRRRRYAHATAARAVAEAACVSHHGDRGFVVILLVVVATTAPAASSTVASSAAATTADSIPTPTTRVGARDFERRVVVLLLHGAVDGVDAAAVHQNAATGSLSCIREEKGVVEDNNRKAATGSLSCIRDETGY